MSKFIYVTTKIEIRDDADSHETISDCDYSFTGDGIIETEIVSVVDEYDVTVF
jgi:hypothetical protein